jgi:mRNA-degrading endonuclease RelE of RelBE toxin-antitoxin system
LTPAPNANGVTDEAYRLSLAPAARRALTEGPPVGLPLAVATAVTEFVTGPLLEVPRVVGKPLVGELAGYHSARRGAYRVVYRIEDRTRTVHVVRIDRRADVYHR